MTIQGSKAAFIQAMDTQGLLELFEHMPGIGFWIKDRQGRLIANNQIGILRKVGCRTEADVLGKTDLDFFPKEMANRFLQDDIRVADAGNRILDQLELILNLDGKIEWHKTTKIPIRDKRGRSLGSAGITVALGKAHLNHEVGPEMLKVMEYIQKNLSEPIYLDDLAPLCGLSTRQFDRRFNLQFRISPIKFVNQFRIKKACRALTATESSIKRIASECGFQNQSLFASQFKRQMNLSPQNFRKLYSTVSPVPLIRSMEDINLLGPENRTK